MNTAQAVAERKRVLNTAPAVGCGLAALSLAIGGQVEPDGYDQS